MKSDFRKFRVYWFSKGWHIMDAPCGIAGAVKHIGCVILPDG